MFQTLRKLKKGTWIFFLIQAIFAAALVVIHLYFPETLPFLFYPEAILGLLLLALGANVFYIIHVLERMENQARKNFINVSSALGADISEAYRFGEIGLLGYDGNQEIIWTSELFLDRKLQLLGMNVLQIMPALKPFFGDLLEKPFEIKMDYAARSYAVMHLSELRILIFKDISEREHLYRMRKEEALVVSTIVLDNYADIVTLGKGETYSQLEGDIRKAILDWAKDYDMLIRRIKDDTYLAFMSELVYAKVAKENFRPLLQVREINKKSEIALTISMGFGRGNPEVARLAELSASAIDVALSRGGNQVVVNNYGSHMEFHGGGADKKIKKNAVRTRVLSLSLFAHLQSNQAVLIVPHDEADFDALGSAFGLYALAKSAKRQAYIVIEEAQIEPKTRAGLRQLFKKEELDAMWMAPSKALDAYNVNTLVIMTDFHRPMLATAPKLLEAAKRVAVLDHHRRAEDVIDNPIFNVIDPTASSTSEIVVELIRYNKEKVDLPSSFATLMFAGMLLDTNNFKAHTTTNTFEAATYLKERGADNVKADSFMKDEYEEYLLKTKIMSNLESPHFGIMVAAASPSDIIDRTALAKAGDEAMSVNGIKAIFVIGRIAENQVGISARSDGTMNVQMIMEKMGGGGHFSSAAVQLDGQDIAKARQDLLDMLNLYAQDMHQE